MRRILTLITTAAVALGLMLAGPASAGIVVKATNFAFKPKNVTIRKGQAVTWKNVEGTHTVTIRALNYDRVISNRNRTVSKTFRQRGTFRVVCRFHQSFGMVGKVIVE